MTQFVRKIYWNSQLQIIKWAKEGSLLFSPWEPRRKQEFQGEDQSPATSPTATLSQGFTPLVFPKLIHVPAGLEKQKGQALSPPVQVLQDEEGTPRAQLHHLKCIPSSPS